MALRRGDGRAAEAYFAKLTAAIQRRNPNAVALVSIFRVPKVDDGFSTAYGGGLYETTQLVAAPNAVAKTEIEIPAKISSPPDEAGHASDPHADAFERSRAPARPALCVCCCSVVVFCVSLVGGEAVRTPGKPGERTASVIQEFKSLHKLR